MDLFKGIGDFFGGLFGQKKKKEEQPQVQQPKASSAVSFNKPQGVNTNSSAFPNSSAKPATFGKSSTDITGVNLPGIGGSQKSQEIKPITPVKPTPQIKNPYAQEHSNLNKGVGQGVFKKEVLDSYNKPVQRPFESTKAFDNRRMTKAMARNDVKQLEQTRDDFQKKSFNTGLFGTSQTSYFDKTNQLNNELTDLAVKNNNQELLAKQQAKTRYALNMANNAYSHNNSGAVKAVRELPHTLNPASDIGLFGTKQQQRFSKVAKPLNDNLEKYTNWVDSGDKQAGFQWNDVGDYVRFAQKLPSGMASGILDAPNKVGGAMTGEFVDKDGVVSNKNAIQRAAMLGDAYISTGGLAHGASAKMLGALGKNTAIQTGGQAAKSGLMNGLKDFAKGVLTEGGEEMAQNLLGELGERGHFDNGTLNRTLEAGAMGMLGGAIMDGSGRVISGARNAYSKNTNRASGDNNLRTINPYSVKNNYEYSDDIRLKQDSPRKNTQFELLQKTNPMLDDYHTGIRSVEDIRKFEDNFGDDESFAYPDFTEKDAQAIDPNGKIRVYSSKDINTGDFVTPSKMMAQDYAGGAEPNSKLVNVNDVAWINGDEGNYLPVDQNIKYKIQAETNQLTAKLDELKSRHQNLTGDEDLMFNIFKDEIQKNALGYFDPKTNKINLNDLTTDTLNHEIGHKIFSRVPMEQKADLINEIRSTFGDEALISKYGKDYGDDINILAEERLADGFNEYYQGKLNGEDSVRLGTRLGIPPKVLAYYDRMIEAIKSVFGATDELKKFYAEIETGRFAENHFADVGKMVDGEAVPALKIDPSRALNTIKDFEDVLSGNKPLAKMATVSPELATRIYESTGILVKPGADYELVKNNAIHINNRHIYNKADSNPLTDSDIASLPYVLENPDTIKIGNKTRLGDRIRLERKINKDHIAVVEVIKKGNALNVVTYFNDSSSTLPNATMSPVDIRPEREQSTNLDNSISQNTDEVKYKVAFPKVEDFELENEYTTPYGLKVSKSEYNMALDEVIAELEPELFQAYEKAQAGLAGIEEVIEFNQFNPNELKRMYGDNYAEHLDRGMISRMVRKDSKQSVDQAAMRGDMHEVDMEDYIDMLDRYYKIKREIKDLEYDIRDAYRNPSNRDYARGVAGFRKLEEAEKILGPDELNRREQEYKDKLRGKIKINFGENTEGESVRVYRPQSEKEISGYIKDQLKDQVKSTKTTWREKLNNFKAKFTHQMIDDAVAYEKYMEREKGRTGKQDLLRRKTELREKIDRVRASDMIAKQFIEDNGLAELGKMSVKDMNDFQQYLIAKRHIEDLVNRNIETGRDYNLDRSIVEKFSEKFKDQEKIFRDFNKALLHYMADNDLISQDSANSLIKNNPNYAPFQRIMDDAEQFSGKSKQLGNLSKETVIQKMKGSKRTVANPVESVIQNTLRAVNEVERNNAANSVAKGVFGEYRLKEGQKPREGYDKISFFQKGEKVEYEVPALVAKEMKNLNSVMGDSAELIMNIFGAPVKALRAGATTSNPIFAVSNLVRDQIQTIFTGNLKASLNGLGPALQVVTGVGKNADALRAELARNGVIGSSYRQTYGFKHGDLVKELQGEYGKHHPIIKTAQKLRHPIETLADVIGKTEEFTRAQQYFGTDGDSVTKAQAAKNNTLNFSRGGSAVRVLNRIIPFLNAGVQGGRSTVNTFKTRPVHSTVATVAMGGLMYAIVGQNQGENKEVWDRIPESEKKTNIIIVNKNSHYDEKTGRVEGVIKIPIPQYLYPLSDAVSNFKGKPEDAIRIGGDIFTAISGVDAENPVNQLTPTAAKPFVEAALNKNSFSGKELVSEYDKNKAPEDKGAKYSTGFARQMAQLTGVDAPIIDNFIQNWSGGLGRDLAKNLTDNPNNEKDGGGFSKYIEDGFGRRFLSANAKSQYQIAEEHAKDTKARVDELNLTAEEKAKVKDRLDADFKAIAKEKANIEKDQEGDGLSKSASKLKDSDFGGYIDDALLSKEERSRREKQEKKKALYASNDTEYNKMLKDYNENKADYTVLEDLEARAKLHRAKVGKDFSKDTREAYSVNKHTVELLLNQITDESQRNEFKNQLLAYGDKLVAAGVEKKNKFRDKYGNVDFSSSSSGSSRKGKSANHKARSVSALSSGGNNSNLMKLLNGTRDGDWGVVKKTNKITVRKNSPKTSKSSAVRFNKR